MQEEALKFFRLFYLPLVLCSIFFVDWIVVRLMFWMVFLVAKKKEIYMKNKQRKFLVFLFSFTDSEMRDLGVTFYGSSADTPNGGRLTALLTMAVAAITMNTILV